MFLPLMEEIFKRAEPAVLRQLDSSLKISFYFKDFILGVADDVAKNWIISRKPNGVNVFTKKT